MRARAQLKSILHDKFSELLPLDQATQDVKDMADEMQREVRRRAVIGSHVSRQVFAQICLRVLLLWCLAPLLWPLQLHGLGG